MQTRSIGASGIQVAPIGLGGMPMSIRNRPPEAQSVEVIRAAVDGGMTLIDTADVYCIDDDDIGHNERLIKKALEGRTDVVVATKGGLERPRGAWVSNGRPEHLTSACERSLTALGVESIAIYQLHAPDGSVPFEDTIGALAKLRQAGKIQHVGLSNVSVSQIEAAARIVPIVSVQNRCNPIDLRAFKDGVLRYCEEHNIAFLPYSPVGGSYEKESIGTHLALRAVAERRDATAYQVALAWLVAKSKVMIPIPGASRIESAQSSAEAMKIELTAEELSSIDGVLGLT